MKLFPAVDMLGGRCVRLFKGKYDQVTDYGSPLECAERWAEAGAEHLHLVDLDGALTGKEVNLEFIRLIKSRLNLYVQTGGGIRTEEDVASRIVAGADKIILGTMLCENFETVKSVVLKYGADRFIAGVDAKDGFVAVKGWTENSTLTAEDLLKKVRELGIDTAVYTDISRDGALIGVNYAETARLQNAVGMKLIASGGIKDEEDLIKLKSLGVYGAILGKSLYSGNLDLKAALTLCGGSKNV